MISYFKKQRRDRILFLLRPNLARSRGCLYFFLKCVLVVYAVSVSAHSLHLFRGLEGKIDDNLVFAITLSIWVPFIFLSMILVIDFLERHWRRKLSDEEAPSLNLRRLLEMHIERHEAVGLFDQHRLQYILSEPGDISARLDSYSYRQLMTIEDAVLYNDEIKGTMNGFSYGVRIMVGLTISFGFIAFVSAYQSVQSFVFDIIGRQRGQFMMLFLFVPVACFGLWVAAARSLYYWNMIGCMWRSYARVAIYYWPVTLGILLVMRVTYAAYQG